MAEPSPELFGRGKILRFVNDALDRPDRRDTPPVVLLIGPGGSGKTALLDRLQADHEMGAPTARFDFAPQPNASPAQTMIDIVSALRPGVKRIGKLQFPLLGTGIIAVTLDPDNPQTPTEQLDARLSSGLSGKALASLVAQAGTMLPGPQQAMASEAGAVLGWAIDGIRGRERDRRLDWYARNFHRGNGTRLGPLLELYERWRAAVTGAEGDTRTMARGDVWRALCAALLADLRSEFDHATFKHGRRTVNCLVLLDNVDTTAGTEFLLAIVESRSRSPGDPDPLLAVATQGTRARHPRVGQPIGAADSRLDHAVWRTRARDPESPPQHWYPIQLTDLSEENVEKIVTSHVLGSVWQDAQFVHAVTGGHSAAVWELARVLSRPHASADIRDLVTAEVTGTLLSMLRPTWLSDEDLDAMAVFCGTLRPTPKAGRGAFRYLQWKDAGQMDVSGLLLDLMWAAEEDGAFVVRPLPGLLLSRWLARSPELWEATHRGLLAHYRASKDELSQHYHLLALTASLSAGDLGIVARYLDRRLDDLPPAEWDSALDAITTAPNRLWQTFGERMDADLQVGPDLRGNPRAVVLQVAGGSEAADRLHIVTRLLAGLWLFKDPLLDPRRRLARLLGQAYQALADAQLGDTGIFDARARHFFDIARKWE